KATAARRPRRKGDRIATSRSLAFGLRHGPRPATSVERPRESTARWRSRRVGIVAARRVAELGLRHAQIDVGVDVLKLRVDVLALRGDQVGGGRLAGAKLGDGGRVGRLARLAGDASERD